MTYAIGDHVTLEIRNPMPPLPQETGSFPATVLHVYGDGAACQIRVNAPGSGWDQWLLDADSNMLKPAPKEDKTHMLRITKEEYQKAVAEHQATCAKYLAEPLQLITEEQYWYWLECLPPLHWERGDGVERFCMMEFTIGDVTRQVAEYKPNAEAPAVHASKHVLSRDRSTWITADMVKATVVEKEAKAA